MVVTLDSHAGVCGSNLFYCFLFVFFSFSIRNIFFPFITTLKLHISYTISLVSPNCYFFYFLLIFSPTVSLSIFISEMMSCYLSILLIFSPTVSIGIFISEMMSCYLSMLVILNLLDRFTTFHM